MADQQKPNDVEKAGSDSEASEQIIAASSNKTSLRDYWVKDVDVRYGDWLLFACCVTTGLLDTSTFRNYAAFVSMQTGNTVILCLSSAGFPDGQPWAYAVTLISLISFFIGAFVTTRLSTLFGAKRRWVFTCNMLLQAILCTVAAALATGHVLISDNEFGGNAAAVLRDPRILIPIGPLAFQSGATIATSRLIGFGNEIPVTVYTSTYAALAGDPNLFALPTKNKPRDRRVLAVISIFCGAFISTWLERKSVGPVATFWMAAGIKFCLAASVAVLFPRAKLATPKA